jgi:hypothetical protein
VSNLLEEVAKQGVQYGRSLPKVVRRIGSSELKVGGKTYRILLVPAAVDPAADGDCRDMPGLDLKTGY